MGSIKQYRAHLMTLAVVLFAGVAQAPEVQAAPVPAVTQQTDAAVPIATTQLQQGQAVVQAPRHVLPQKAAAGYSLLYLLFGGGLFGAIVIFFVAKAFHR